MAPAQIHAPYRLCRSRVALLLLCLLLCYLDPRRSGFASFKRSLGYDTERTWGDCWWIRGISSSVLNYS